MHVHLLLSRHLTEELLRVLPEQDVHLWRLLERDWSRLSNIVS